MTFSFEFFDVLPGQYTVKGSHETWKFLTVNFPKKINEFSNELFPGHITCSTIKRTLGNRTTDRCSWLYGQSKISSL